MTDKSRRDGSLGTEWRLLEISEQLTTRAMACKKMQPHACVSQYGSISVILPGGLNPRLFLCVVDGEEDEVPLPSPLSEC